MKYVCKVCGYVYEGDNPPEECPKCHQKEVFEPVETAKNPYSGTKTEKNLLEAFAGESQARNKYTYFASVAKKAGFEQIAALFLKTAQNEKEPNCGLKHSACWAILLKISSLQPMAKTMNGQICMSAWQGMRMKKDSRNLQNSSGVLLRLKRHMKNATGSFLIM